MSSHLPTPSFQNASEEAPKLVRHVSRPVWGRGVLVRNAPTRRAYQFEDGQTRTFKSGFYHLLEEIDVDDATTRKLAARLEARAEDRAEVREALATRSTRGNSHEDAMNNLAAQVRWFLREHPEAFEGEAWTTQFRGESVRRLKRHRDPILEDAKAFFSEENLREALTEEDVETVRQGILSLLEKTDLVTTARRRPLQTAKLDLAWLEALIEVLHGETTFALRFERWVAACDRVADKLATWPMCTIPLALTHPEEHIFVRPSRMKTELAWLSPGQPLPRRPGAPTYHTLTQVFGKLRTALTEAGHAPKDNLDLHDFIMQSTSAPAKEALG